jgi:hypothetical protein
MLEAGQRLTYRLMMSIPLAHEEEQEEDQEEEDKWK